MAKDYTDEVEAAIEDSLRQVRRPQDLSPPTQPDEDQDQGEEVEEEQEKVPRKEVSLPPGVMKFIDSIGNNFAGTAERCTDTAKRLRNIADMLDKRADALKKAGPQLTADVRDWISLERDSNDLEKFYKSLADREEDS